MTDPLNSSDPKNANHHWYPFLRYLRECEKEGKVSSVNDWLISQGKVKDYKAEEKSRLEAEEKSRLEAEEKTRLEAKIKGTDEKEKQI